jgi:hypothetical protein
MRPAYTSGGRDLQFQDSYKAPRNPRLGTPRPPEEPPHNWPKPWAGSRLAAHEAAAVRTVELVGQILTPSLRQPVVVVLSRYLLTPRLIRSTALRRTTHQASLWC